MAEAAQGRELSFDDLEEVARDVQHVQAAGYARVGQWDLGQTCGHLVCWMRYPLDGYPRSGWFMRAAFAVLRLTWGRRTLRKMLSEGVMRSGAPTLPATVPAAGGSEAAAVEQLCATIERWQRHEGELHTSPVFGAMDRASATRLQLLHCAHHLSFLIPSG